MDDIKTIKKVFVIGLPCSFFLMLFLCLLVNQSGSGDSSVIAGNFFTIPFEQETSFTITSKFGSRLDPFGSEEEKFHTGIDLATSSGTPVLASADGTVVETGFSESGLGNYVYVEHNFDGLIYYTAYGHMLDDSIVVSEGQKITRQEKIGSVGSTGASTGNHLHFMIMTPKLSFEKKYLVDPIYVIEGLD